MKPQAPVLHDEYDALILDGEEVEEASEEDLWLLRLVSDFNWSSKLKLKRCNFTLALRQHVKNFWFHNPAALVRFTRNLSRLRW